MTGPTILVCGFGRCGSSLMMQMLAAGGVPTTGKWPDYEDGHAGVIGGSIDAAWLESVRGHAIKVLDPHRVSIPRGDYGAIWLDRDPMEQARSQAKFLSLMAGIPSNRHTTRALAASYATDKPKALRSLRDAGAGILHMTFEDLLDPCRLRDAVTALAAFLGHRRDLDEVAMLRAVRPRGPRCAPGLDMELALMREKQAA